MPWTPPTQQGEYGYGYAEVPYESTEGYYADAVRIAAYRSMFSTNACQQYYEQPMYRTPPQPIINNGIQTRSGRSLSSPSATPEGTPATSRMSSSPSPKKRNGKKNKKSTTNIFHIEKPLSQMLDDFDVTPEQVKINIEAHINRSPDDRQAEAKKRRDGKTPRPMNSFMLYRMAYKQVIQAWARTANNNQFISQVAGKSWNLETEDIKKSFEKYAITERDNHQAAFPTYKFAPNKSSRKRARDDPDEDDFDSDAESNYSGAGRRKKAHTRFGSEIPRSVTSTPGPSGMYHPQPGFEHGWQSNGGLLMMPMYDQYGRPVQQMQYQDPMQQPYYPVSQSYQQPPTSMPTQHPGYMMPQQYQQYSMQNPYAVQPQNAFGIDPDLDTFGQGTTYEFGNAQDSAAQYAITSEEQTFAQVPEQVMHPGEQTLSGPVAGWPESGATRNVFDEELEAYP
ncbi:hypothetical protein LTR66_016692 [Elasticomyces elasticus]|nr:hypothetical protein LTR66_016692 [Elasticomyces elasticus]